MAQKNIQQSTKIPADPCILVIFGITGDLTKRLLYPALCNLGINGLLSKNFSIVGFAHRDYSDEAFREELVKNAEQHIEDPEAQKFGDELVKSLSYISGDFSDPNAYRNLKSKLEELGEKINTKNCLFYLAVPPEFFISIAKNLHKAQLLSEKGDHFFRRIVVEKPFGHDLPSAKKLNQDLLAIVEEKQIFRIDHFLGKETVQNLLAFRFSNGIFEPIWNRRYIDHVQITVSETIGIESRGAYYEKAGALRDMLQNHLFQVLSLIAMEPPSSFSGDNIQVEKAKVFRTIQTLTPEQVLLQAVRGQYGPGQCDNERVKGYRSESRVDPNSTTETYVALKLLLDNWRWLGVPFYLRTGKRMKSRTSEIVIQFKSGPSALFTNSKEEINPNILFINIQPEEGISLRLNAKIPGPSLNIGQVEMRFRYSDYFGIKLQTGYETILYDCMLGDHTLFNHSDMVESSWAVVQPILELWGAIHPTGFPNYAAGSWGPIEADSLLQKDGRKWLIC